MSKSKPEWSDAPEWAKWLAQDKDGWYSWWNIEPVACDKAECWNQGKPMEEWEYLDVSVGALAEDWRKALEPRP